MVEQIKTVTGETFDSPVPAGCSSFATWFRPT